MPKAKKNAHLWERDPNDWYPEPPWCAQALFREETFAGPLLDPCAGLGHIPAAARAAGYQIEAADLVDRGVDGVTGGQHYALSLMTTQARTVITNPPFNQAEELIRTALSLGKDVAAFLPLRFAGGARRSRWIASTPLARLAVLAPRPSCPPGPVWVAGEAEGSGAVDFAWFLWSHGWAGPPAFGWVRR